VVYSGVAALWDTRSTSSSRADDLRPVSGADLWTLARLWEGPVVVIFDAPFGGVLKRSVPADLAPRTALWLSAGQENGMTFGGGRLPQEGTTALMVEATRAGLSGESIKELAERHRVLNADSGGPDFQIGVPEWLGPLHPPFWSTTHATLARNEVLKWSWWSDSVASGGRLDVAAEDLSPVALRNLRSARTAAAAGRWREATRLLADLAHLPAVALRLAALHEILGDHDAARAHYDRYLTAAAAAGTRPPATMPETTAVVERARERQGRFVERVRQRAGALKPARSRIHFVGVAVQEYVLPEIGDLAFPAQDILMWEQALKTSFGDRVVVHPVLRDRSVADIRAALETIAAETTEHELVVLVYSGRGLEQDGQKYVTGADSRLTRQDQFQVVASTWDTTRLIAVSDVARTFANRDLVMVLDAQLSAPRRDEMSARHKHIASILGDKADAPFIDPGPTRRYPAPAELRRHLYVWWEGVLGEPLADDTDVDGGAGSPLTRALVRTLPGGETYGEWLERAGSLLRTGDGGRADAFGRLAVQGPEHRPLMSAGVSLEQAVHLALQVDRTEANLELGSSWAEQHAKVWSLPDDRLARAALLVSLGRVQLSQGANGTAAFESAIVLLDEMRREAAALARPGLLIDYVHWYTAALDEGLQDPDRALGALIEIIGDDRDRQPAPELVARLLQLTERAASTTATEKLRRSRDLLRSLRRDDAQLDSAIGRLESLLREQLRGARGAGITMQ
ncbi:MAG: caspase family protein, partial [Vicinamibacterales bacterium]